MFIRSCRRSGVRGKAAHYASLKGTCADCTLETSFDRKRVLKMFSDNLSDHILQILSSKELSYESAAELCDMSPRHLGNIVRRCTVPSVAMLEKICRGLNATPNGLARPGAV